MCVVQVRSSEMFTPRYLKATHPLHRGPTDHKRSVGLLLSLPEVHDQLLSFAHVQRETVVLAPWCKSLHLIQVCGLVIVVDEAQNHSIIRKFDNRGGAVRGHAVVGCIESIAGGSGHSPVGAPMFRVMELEVNWPTFTTCGLAVRKSWIQSQSEVFRPRSWEFNSQLGGDYSVESWAVVYE